MVNSSPPEPSSPPPRKPILDFDEWVALIVAFGAIAAILFWGVTRKTNLFTFRPDLFATQFSEAEGEDRSRLSWKKEPKKSRQRQTDKLEEGDRSTRASESQPSPAEKSGIFSLLPSLAGQQLLTQPTAPTTVPSTPAESPTADNPAETPAASVPLAPTSPQASPSPPKTSPAEQSKIEFSDLPEEYWASTAIATLVEKGVISGFPDRTFAPDRPATRAEFAVQLQKIFEREASRSAIEFEDVAGDYWGAAGIERAVKMGFMKGYPGEVFKPEETITRLQVLLALAAGLNLKASNAPAETLEIYADAGEIPAWATEAIAAATEAGLVVNHPDVAELNPNQPAARADVAAMVYQALARSGEVEEWSSEYIVPARK